MLRAAACGLCRRASLRPWEPPQGLGAAGRSPGRRSTGSGGRALAEGTRLLNGRAGCGLRPLSQQGVTPPGDPACYRRGPERMGWPGAPRCPVLAPCGGEEGEQGVRAAPHVPPPARCPPGSLRSLVGRTGGHTRLARGLAGSADSRQRHIHGDLWGRRHRKRASGQRGRPPAHLQAQKPKNWVAKGKKLE